MGTTGPGRERAPRGAAGPFVARVLRRYPGIILELRTARANGVPHSTIRRGRNPRKWTQTDRTLALALTVHEDGLHSCGHPRDRAWNEDMEGWYTPHRVVCQACRAAALDMDARGKLQAGESTFVTDDTPAGFEPDPRMMPTFSAKPVEGSQDQPGADQQDTADQDPDARMASRG